MDTKHSIVRYIKPGEIISDMIAFHKMEQHVATNRLNEARTQRERQIYQGRLSVHREMKEFWETVTFEPLKET